MAVLRERVGLLRLHAADAGAEIAADLEEVRRLFLDAVVIVRFIARCLVHLLVLDDLANAEVADEPRETS